MEFTSYCAVLGLPTVHSVDELNAVYRPLIRHWHPDRHHGQASHAAAVDRAASINQAYAFLLHALLSGGDSKRPDASVLEIFVKPCSIVSVGYNGQTADLYVKYLGSRIYRYRRVPSSVFEALLAAPSASVFVSAHVDRTYEYEVLPRAAKAPFSQP